MEPTLIANGHHIVGLIVEGVTRLIQAGFEQRVVEAIPVGVRRIVLAVAFSIGLVSRTIAIAEWRLLG